MERMSPASSSSSPSARANPHSQSPTNGKPYAKLKLIDANGAISSSSLLHDMENTKGNAALPAAKLESCKLHHHDIKTQSKKQKKSPSSSSTTTGSMFSIGTGMILNCFIIFMLIHMWNSARRAENHSLRLVPNIAMYRLQRRLQARAEAGFKPELMLLNPRIHGIRSKPENLQVCKHIGFDHVPCYNASTAATNQNTVDGGAADESSIRRSHGIARRECSVHEGRRSDLQTQCIFPAPDGYKLPLRWPASAEGAWHGNMKFIDGSLLSGNKIISRTKLQENGMVRLNADDCGLGDGAAKQIIDSLAATQSEIRTVLDINCGLQRTAIPADLSRLLEKASILCISAYEEYGSHVQFALERGFPAMIASFASSQLPFPSFSFDMIHCFDCAFDWSSEGGILQLLELDRVLRYNGVFMWTWKVLPQAELRHVQPSTWNKTLAFDLCWSPLSADSDSDDGDGPQLWRKAANSSCYARRKMKAKKPKLCGQQAEDAKSSTVATAYAPLRGCISKPVKAADKGSNRSQIASVSGFAGASEYWTLLTPSIFSDHPKRRQGEGEEEADGAMLRNVMDMNAGSSSFALSASSSAALGKPDVWVMNVISSPDAVDSALLHHVYDRGQLGVWHNWCEAFPTYPRTYDLLHGIALLSQMQAADRCGLSSLLFEMDRILRPEGWVILRDRSELIEEVRAWASRRSWETRVVQTGDQQLLVCQKPAWKRSLSGSASY